MVPGPFHGPLTYLSHEDIRPGMRCSVPLGRRTVVGVSVDVEPDADIDPAKLKFVTAVLDEEPVLTADILQLATWMARYYFYEFSSAFLLALPAMLRKGEAPSVESETLVHLTLEGKHVDPAQLAKAPKQQKIVEYLQRVAPISLKDLKQDSINRAALTPLQKKNLVELKVLDEREPIVPSAHVREEPLHLNKQQVEALAHIGTEGFKPCLLEGVTGSGKTEVYLQAIQRCLERGQRALVLVPEIGLTPQTIKRFERRFSDPIVTLHSGMSDQARQRAWYKARLGRASIVIGTRSAVLTPIPDLGLIVVDEEHDISYKQQDTLRYHARDVAIVRAQRLGIPIVLGSATPSLESLHRALLGHYAHLTLTERAQGQSMPIVETINMRRQRHEAGLSERLALRIREHLSDGNQVLLFLNRRGYAPNWFCSSCGWMADCMYCDAHLTHHRAEKRNICHHCGHQELPVIQCPSCGHAPLQPMGTGTERAEEMLSQWFPGVPIIRFDRDVAGTKNKFEQQLSETENEGAAIILGTQMLAKGHHFERVTLVGLWDIDAGLFSADLRAQERMGQLFIQVAGRSGRGQKRGEVLIQTWYPDHDVFKPLLQHDYRTFAAGLLAERRKAHFPPFGFLAVIRCDSAFAHLAEARLKDMADYLLRSRAVRVLGPLPALLSRRAGKHRYMLLVQSEKRSDLHKFLLPLYEYYPRDAKHVSWHIDIDPVDLA